MDVPALIDEALGTSARHADKLLARFDKSADYHGVSAEKIRLNSSFVADPVLERVKRVRVVTFDDEKDIAETPSDAELDRHLKAHGIVAAFDTVKTGGR